MSDRSRPRADTDRVRYLAYGSNTDPDRLRAYIEGSGADGPYGAHVGSTDHTPVSVVDTRWVPGRLAFGGRSRRWGGGVALATLRRGRPELFVVEYEMSRRQLHDLAVQENGNDTDVRVDWVALELHGHHVVGSGLYGLVTRAERDASAVLLTSPLQRPHVRPTPAYLDTVRRGLCRWLPPARVEAYLAVAEG